ncbi:MAG TPA: hypothetical protein VJ916_04055 [Anaerovoracaceae bacterium]|nr:hypothetical protein [Anaerovoracaceae bacterium]
MKTRQNIRLIIVTILCIMIIPIAVYAATPSFNATSSVSSIDPNGTFVFNVGGQCCGRVNISVSNGSASQSSIWVENNTVPVNITAGSSGNCTVTATPAEGMSDLDANLYSPGTRSVTVGINEPAEPEIVTTDTEDTDQKIITKSTTSNTTTSSTSKSNSETELKPEDTEEEKILEEDVAMDEDELEKEIIEEKEPKQEKNLDWVYTLLIIIACLVSAGVIYFKINNEKIFISVFIANSIIAVILLMISESVINSVIAIIGLTLIVLENHLITGRIIKKNKEV